MDLTTLGIIIAAVAIVLGLINIGWTVVTTLSSGAASSGNIFGGLVVRHVIILIMFVVGAALFVIGLVDKL